MKKRYSEEFKTQILLLLRKHLPELSDKAVQDRPSQDGKYLALSITLYVNNREQLDTIYREITASPLVLMAL